MYVYSLSIILFINTLHQCMMHSIKAHSIKAKRLSMMLSARVYLIYETEMHARNSWTHVANCTSFSRIHTNIEVYNKRNASAKCNVSCTDAMECNTGIDTYPVISVARKSTHYKRYPIEIFDVKFRINLFQQKTFEFNLLIRNSRVFSEFPTIAY